MTSDPVFTLLSLQHILFIYSYFIFVWLSPATDIPDMFHIYPSMGECWCNEIYICVCRYVCVRVPKQYHVAITLWKPPRNKSFYFPGWFFIHIEFISSTYGQKATNWVRKRGSLPTRTMRRNLLYCHKQHQWNEAEVSISGKWKAVGGLCGTVEADITCNKSFEGHTYMHLCLHLLLNGLHSNT